MYTNSSKYIPPPKRANWVKPTPLPKNKQVTFQEPPRTSNRPTQKPQVQQNMKPKVPVNLSTRTKPATESRKPMPKSHTRNHRILPSTSVNARRAADHNRKLHVVDHNQIVIRPLKSVNTKNPQAKHSVNHTKKVWKATRNHNVNTTKTAWRPTGKVLDCKLSVREAGPKGLSGILNAKHCQKDVSVLISIAESLTRPIRFQVSQSYCSISSLGYSKVISWNAEERDVVPPGERRTLGNLILRYYGKRALSRAGKPVRKAEAVATACYTQNQSLIHTRYNKTPYELFRNSKSDLKFLHIFGALCYPINDGEDLGKLKPKANICIFIGIIPNSASSTLTQPPSKKELDILFQPMFDEYFKPTLSVVSPTISSANLSQDTTGAISSTKIDQDAHSPSTTQLTNETITPIQDNNVEEQNQENQDTEFNSDTFTNSFAPPKSCSTESSTMNVGPSNMHTFNQLYSHTRKWTKDHPLETIIGNPSQPVQQDDNSKTMLCAMQEEIHEFDRHQVWELVPRPSHVLIISLKLIFKVKLDEYWGVLKNKARLKKDLYGLKQAPRAWYDMLSKFPVSQKFVKGLQVSQSPRGIFINQSKYALEMLKKYGMESSDVMDTPMVKHSKLDEDQQGNPLKDYEFEFNRIPLYCDSKSAIALSCNSVWHSRTMHINVRYHYIKEKVKDGTVELYFVKTSYQLADIFTKALGRERFEFSIDHLGMQSITLEKLKSLAESKEE
ncbi:hypothetical protein Tco_0490686 [Tanacetum coccineum]